MNYKPGDILLKIDTRAYKSEGSLFNTRDHVMMVIGGRHKEGLPMVAHMTFHNQRNQPGIKIEALNRGKDLYLLSYGFSEKVRKEIVDLVFLAEKSQKFIITSGRIESQYLSSETYRQSKNLGLSLNQFVSSDDFSPNPKQAIEISCHEFVLSIIHQACKICGEAIPVSLRLPPAHAWSDILLSAANLNKMEVKVDYIPYILATGSERKQFGSFFGCPHKEETETLSHASSCSIL